MNEEEIQNVLMQLTEEQRNALINLAIYFLLNP